MDTPDDYVLATNETHPVREFVERAFKFVKIDIQWQGEKGTVTEASTPTLSYLCMGVWVWSNLPRCLLFPPDADTDVDCGG